MSRINLLTMQALASVLIFFLSACAEDPLGGNDQTGKGHTVTLQLSATVAPIPETKTTTTPAHPGSETETAGFYSERVSSDADRATTTPGFDLETGPIEEENINVDFETKALATRAPSKLKNVYAFLFASDGTFNGRANIGAFTHLSGTARDICATSAIAGKGEFYGIHCFKLLELHGRQSDQRMGYHLQLRRHNG